MSFWKSLGKIRSANRAPRISLTFSSQRAFRALFGCNVKNKLPSLSIGRHHFAKSTQYLLNLFFLLLANGIQSKAVREKQFNQGNKAKNSRVRPPEPAFTDSALGAV